MYSTDGCEESGVGSAISYAKPVSNAYIVDPRDGSGAIIPHSVGVGGRVRLAILWTNRTREPPRGTRLFRETVYVV